MADDRHFPFRQPWCVEEIGLAIAWSVTPAVKREAEEDWR
jgi:hypothetical protein